MAARLVEHLRLEELLPVRAAEHPGHPLVAPAADWR
jgi:hypothetical protein